MLTLRQHGAVTVLVATGRIALQEGVTELRDTINQLVYGKTVQPGQDLPETGKKIDVILNLQGVTYVDSCGIGVLASIFITVSKAGGKLILCGLTQKIKDCLRNAQLHQVFNICLDEAEAYASLVKPIPTRE